MSMYTLELDGGYQVQVEYEYDSPEMGYNGTGYRGGVNVQAMWVNLKDKSNKLLTVDIMHFLTSIPDLVDMQELEEHIENEMDNYEPDPDANRDDE